MADMFDLFNDDFFKDVLQENYRELHRQNELRCSGCGKTYRHFNETGKFGCPTCYETFEPYVTSLIKRIQGSTHYEGAVPNRGSGVFHTKHQIKKLRQQLEKAVAVENFEEAMVLRDQIKALEKTLDQ